MVVANHHVLGLGRNGQGNMAIEAIVAIFDELFNERKAPWLAFAIKKWNFPAAARCFKAFSGSIHNDTDSLRSSRYK